MTQAPTMPPISELHVLLIADHPADVELVRAALAKCAQARFHLQPASSLAEGFAWLAANVVDVVLLDLGLPDSCGLSTLERWLAGASWGAPVVVLTGQADEALGMQSLQRGAQDFLSKDQLNVVDLWRVMRCAIARQRSLSQRADAAQAAIETDARLTSEFPVNISREIRTPMTAILGFSDMLLLPDLTELEQRKYVEMIRSNGEALLQRIDDILSLSRPEAERLPLEKVDCPLWQLLCDVLSVVQIPAEEKGLQLSVVERGGLPEHLHTEPLRLRQILVHLLSNAVKFTSQGEVTLTVQALAEGARLQFAVTDTGSGIAADRLPRLFQSSRPAGGTLPCGHGGTGLDLAIAQRLALVLGGQIQVASEIGRGSTFSLTLEGALPECASPPPPRATPAPRRQAAAAPVARSVQEVRGRVLVAEDSAETQMVVRFLLKKLNLETDLADDGQVACELAQQSQAAGRPYDLILMDILMPRLNGFEATRQLRQQGWHGPIVALTAFAMAGDRERCLQAGCDDYLAKPISTNAFYEILQRYLS